MICIRNINEDLDTIIEHVDFEEKYVIYDMSKSPCWSKKYVWKPFTSHMVTILLLFLLSKEKSTIHPLILCNSTVWSIDLKYLFGPLTQTWWYPNGEFQKGIHCKLSLISTFKFSVTILLCNCVDRVRTWDQKN